MDSSISWSHFWEGITLLGFVLMSGELFTPDNKRLNSQWHAISEWLTRKTIPPSLPGFWARQARQNEFIPILIASWFIWVPLIFAGLVLSAIGYLHFEKITLGGALGALLFYGIALSLLLYASWVGAAMLLFHFLERSRHLEHPYFVGLQLGAYLTIVAQIRKVIYP